MRAKLGLKPYAEGHCHGGIVYASKMGFYGIPETELDEPVSWGKWEVYPSWGKREVYTSWGKRDTGPYRTRRDGTTGNYR